MPRSAQSAPATFPQEIVHEGSVWILLLEPQKVFPGEIMRQRRFEPLFEEEHDVVDPLHEFLLVPLFVLDLVGPVREPSTRDDDLSVDSTRLTVRQGEDVGDGYLFQRLVVVHHLLRPSVQCSAHPLSCKARCAAIRYVSLDDRHTRDSSCSSLTLKLWHLLTGNKGELELGPETFEDKVGSYGGTSQERRIPLHRNMKRLEFGLCGGEPAKVTPLSQE
jgi:hypothetical protein